MIVSSNKIKAMLKAVGITKSYGSLQVVKGVDLLLNKGEIVAIVGSSGAGKSTLLHILGTLDTADSGDVILNNVLLNKLNNKALSKFRNKHIGFIFQFHHLLPEFTAIENVCIPAWIAGVSKKQSIDRATELLERLGLKERLQHKPSTLSGGELQRVAVARALINNPDIVFADEPTGNLDSENARHFHEMLIQLKNEFNQTFLIVTHNDDLAASCDRILHMKDGVIV